MKKPRIKYFKLVNLVFAVTLIFQQINLFSISSYAFAEDPFKIFNHNLAITVSEDSSAPVIERQKRNTSKENYRSSLENLFFKEDDLEHFPKFGSHFKQQFCTYNISKFLIRLENLRSPPTT